jgi:transposase
MSKATKTNRFLPKVCVRAVRMAREHPGEYPFQWAVIESIAPKMGCVAQPSTS